MKVYLVRHGQSVANKVRISQESSSNFRDTPLTPAGRNQAKKIAERLKGEKFEAIYSSPLKRAKKTAEYINKYHGKKIIFEQRIEERNSSIETQEEFVSRINSFYKEIMKKKKGNYLVVAHGGTILAFLALSTGDRIEGGKLWRRNCIATANTSLSIVEKKGEKIERTMIADISHREKCARLRYKGSIAYLVPYKIKKFVKEEVNVSLEEGDCRHKTELLEQIFRDEKFKTRKIYTVFDWKDLPVPKYLLGILKSGTKMVHELLEVNLNGKWLKVDATWDRPLAKIGFPATTHWDGKSDTNMITEGELKFYRTKEEAKKISEVNNNKEELHEFAEKFNAWLGEVREN